MKGSVSFLCAVVLVCAIGRSVVPDPTLIPDPTLTVEPTFSFATIMDAWANIKAEGFHCTSDRADGRVGNGFLVSRDVITSSEACRLYKAGRPGQEWKGKVWLTHISTEDWQLPAAPDDANTRSWGNIRAFGDNDLLNEIESALNARARKRTG
jgi:hypothetical protein